MDSPAVVRAVLCTPLLNCCMRKAIMKTCFSRENQQTPRREEEPESAADFTKNRTFQQASMRRNIQTSTSRQVLNTQPRLSNQTWIGVFMSCVTVSRPLPSSRINGVMV